VGSGWGKTAEERGLKVQSLIQASVEVLLLKKKKTPCWKIKNNLIPDFLGFYKSNWRIGGRYKKAIRGVR